MPGKRCHICDKHNWPRPGSTVWARWTTGLARTARARCDAAGLRGLDSALLGLIKLGEGELPDAALALCADLLIMPTTLVAYGELLDRAVIRAQVYGTLCREGVPHADAEALSIAAADWALARRRAKRLRIDGPSVGGLRFASMVEGDQAAEQEALEIDEALADRARGYALIAARPKEKQASRDQDAADLASGAKSRAELHRENAAFAGLPVRINFAGAKSFG